MSSEQKKASGQNDGGHRPKVTVKYSGIDAVDRIFDLEQKALDDKVPLFGLYHKTPNIWHYVFVDERGRPHHLAMEVFAEIWFRHRPRQIEQRHKNGDVLIMLVKNFNEEKYQFNRADLAHRLNVSKDAVSAALTYLEKLGVIKREYDDTDFNHRGFRNVVYITPVVDKLLGLVAEAEERLKKVRPELEPERKTDDNAQNTERRDVGDVTGIMGATLPASRRHVTGITPPRSPDQAAVSRRSSEKSSASSFSTAKPPSNLEANNNNKKSSAPQAAHSESGVADDESASPPRGAAPPATPAKNGKALPVELEGQNISGLSQKEIDIARPVISVLTKRWKEYFQTETGPEFPPNFAQETAKALVELDCNNQDLIHAISASWILADNYRKPADQKFDGAFWSRRCQKRLSRLFERDRKDNMLAVQHIKEEEVRHGNKSVEEVKMWWFEHVTDVEEES